MTRAVKAIMCVTFLVLTGCANQAGLCEGFDRSVKAYNRMLRWHEIENAGMSYINYDQREEYLKQAETLKKRGLSVADFRILSSQCLPEKNSGEAIAEFDYYLLPSNRIKTISYRQEWGYQEATKNWKIGSGLPLFD